MSKARRRRLRKKRARLRHEQAVADSLRRHKADLAAAELAVEDEGFLASFGDINASGQGSFAYGYASSGKGSAYAGPPGTMAQGTIKSSGQGAFATGYGSAYAQPAPKKKP